MKQLIIFLVIFWINIQQNFARDHQGTSLQYQTGCYDFENCGDTQCKEGCVDCYGEEGQLCKTCLYGYFLFHTPDNTIECLPCPGYDIQSGNAQEKHLCASCIEMPYTWEYDRKCKFKYTFAAQVGGEISTPLNNTLNKPDIYAIKINQLMVKSLTDTRYYVEQLINYCESYTWKNYAYDTQYSEDSLSENFYDEFNNQECEVCLEGYIFIQQQCIQCSDHINLCSGCYIYQSQIACSVCSSGYAPNSEFNQCILCSNTENGGIDNCKECYYNSNQKKIVCSTCADGYRLDQNDSTQCVQTSCSDPNCLSCPDYDFTCETCKSRYKVENDWCVISQECTSEVNKSGQCQNCYLNVQAEIQGYNPLLQCKYCGTDESGDFECKEICDQDYGLSLVDITCQSCIFVDENCTSCFFFDADTFQCIKCKNGYGVNDSGRCTQKCQDIIPGCSECIDYGTGYSCLSCDADAGYGIIYNANYEIIGCKLCSDQDSICSSCVYGDPNQGIEPVIICQSCSNSLYQTDEDIYQDTNGNDVIYQDNFGNDLIKITCQKSDCDHLFSQCQSDKCEINDSYGKYSDEIVFYPTQRNICTACIEGFSLSANGSQCIENVPQCQNSMNLTTTTTTKLNPYFEGDSINGYCYNGCRKEDGSSLANSEHFFYDPYLQKCVLCTDYEMCRNKVIVNKYIYSEDSLEIPEGVNIEDWVYFNDLMSDSAVKENFFNLDFSDATYLAWEDVGVSEFQFNINFVTKSGSTAIFNYQDRYEQGMSEIELVIEIQSNISNNIFRVKDIIVNLQTWEYAKLLVDQQTINFNAQTAMIYADYYEIIINGVTEFNMQSLHFTGGSKLTAEAKQYLRESNDYQTLFIPFKVYMQDNLPMSVFKMQNVFFFHQIDTYLVPKFLLQDLGTLQIEKMTFSAKETDSKALTGFNMFSFIKYRVEIQPFNLVVKEFYIYNMYLENSIIFEIPQKKANVEFNNILLNNLVFKNSIFLGDTSSGLGKGEQWIRFDQIGVNNSQFYDSSLIYVANAQYFLAFNWQISSVHSVLVDNDSQSFIVTNTFKIDSVFFYKMVCYGTQILKHIESPSVVEYYLDSNIFKRVTLMESTVYLKQSENLYSLLGFMNIELEEFIFMKIYIADGLKINSDVVSYYHSEEQEIKAISRFVIISMTDTQIPDWLMQIYSKTVTSTANLKTFVAFDMDNNFNLLEIVNLKEVIIEQFSCGSLEPSQIYKGNCIKAHTTGTAALGTLSITKGMISNIQSIDSTPIRAYGFSTIMVSTLHVQGVKARSGFHFQPWGNEGIIIIDNCFFTLMTTDLEKQLEVTGSALYMDGTIALKNTFTVKNSYFESIYTRYQGAGVYVNSPINSCHLYLQSVNMTNVYGIQGGYIHAKLSGISQSSVNLKDILFQGKFNETYQYGVRKHDLGLGDEENGDDEDDDEEDVDLEFMAFRDSPVVYNITLDSFKAYFKSVNEYKNEDGEYFGEEEDSILTAANLYPSAIYLDSTTVNIENMLIQDIKEQQGLRIENSMVQIVNLTHQLIHCIECSQYGGSSILKNSMFDISNSVFSHSQASVGAGLYIADKGVCNTHCTFYNTTFVYNWAFTLGGGLYIKDTFYQITDCKFIGNGAQGVYSGENTIRGQGGALFTEISNKIDVSSLESGRRNLEADNTLQIISGTLFEFNQAQIGGAGRIMGGFNTTISNSKFKDNSGSQFHDDLVLHCVYGEGKSSDGKCQICPEGQYSLDPYGETCVECQTGTICKGGDRVYNNASYWRDNNLTDEFWHCENAPSNCEIGMDYINKNYTSFSCKEGYIGARCEACDLSGKHTKNGEKYSVSSIYTCGKCSDQETNALKVFFMNVWVLFSMFIAVQGTLKLVQEKIMLRSIMTLFRGFRPRYDQTGILIKMFTNYAQIIVIVSTLDIDLPNGLTDFQDVVGNPVKSMGNALDCYLVEFQDKIPNIYFKIIFQMVMNIIQFLVFVMLFAIARMLKQTRISFYHLFWTTNIYLLIYLQPSYVNAILETLSCLKLGSYAYILSDPQYYCYTPEYNLWTYGFLFPFLSLWVIILPGLMLYILRKHKKRESLQDAETLYNYGFLYQEYRQEVYYWELIKVFQKTLIVAVIQLYSNDIKEKAILVFEIVFIYAILSYYRKPYQSKGLNDLDLLSSIICCLSLITGVFIYKIQYDYWMWIGLVTIFFVNVYFVCVMIYKILAKFRSNFVSQYQYEIEEVKKKIPLLKMIFKLSPEIIDRRRENWKKFRNHVYLFIDGRKCGLIQLALQKNNINSQQQLDDENGYFLHGIQGVQKQHSIEVIDEDEESNKYPKLKNSKISMRNNQDPGLTLKKHISRGKTFVLPDIDVSQTNQFIRKQETQFTSIQVLNNELTHIQKEKLIQVVEQFRIVQKKQEEEIKALFKEYLMNELNIKPYISKTQDDEVSQNNSPQQQNSKICQVQPLESIQKSRKESVSDDTSIMDNSEHVDQIQENINNHKIDELNPKIIQQRQQDENSDGLSQRSDFQLRTKSPQHTQPNESLDQEQEQQNNEFKFLQENNSPLSNPKSNEQIIVKSKKAHRTQKNVASSKFNFNEGSPQHNESKTLQNI